MDKQKIHLKIMLITTWAYLSFVVSLAFIICLTCLRLSTSFRISAGRIPVSASESGKLISASPSYNKRKNIVHLYQSIIHILKEKKKFMQ